ADGPAAVPGGDGGGDGDAGGLPGPGAAVAAEPQGAARPGDHLPDVPAQGAGAALRQRPGAGRRPPPLPRRAADPGPAGGLGRAVRALGPPQPGGGGAGGGGAGPGRAGDRRRLLAAAAAVRAARGGGPSGGAGVGGGESGPGERGGPAEGRS